MLNVILENLMILPMCFFVGSYFFLFYKEYIRINRNTPESDILLSHFVYLKRFKK